MDWVAAKSYYIGYNSINRFLSILFFYSYLLTWSIALITSLVLPLLFIFAPSSLQTTRTRHFLIICIICLSNMFCLYLQVYLISGLGEPNLSYHTCRFIVYISTFAKPFGIYLTLLFSIERLFTKILSKFFLRLITYRQLCQRLYTVSLILCTIMILSMRLYQVLKLIPRSQAANQQSSDTDFDVRQDITDTNNNSTDRNITFKYCFSSMNIDTYAKLLSFYLIQYVIESIAFGIISLISLILLIQQCYLLRTQRSSTPFSINTKLYLSLSLSVIISESILFFFHNIVDDIYNNNTDLQLTYLQFMSFVFNFRCILLPFIICIITCNPLKQFLYELFILRSYLDNVDESDLPNTMDDRAEPFSSSQRTSTRLQQKFRRTFKKNNNNEHFDNDELQADL